MKACDPSFATLRGNARQLAATAKAMSMAEFSDTGAGLLVVGNGPRLLRFNGEKR